MRSTLPALLVSLVFEVSFLSFSQALGESRNNLSALRKDTETSSLGQAFSFRGFGDPSHLDLDRHTKAHEVLAGVNMLAVL